MDVSPRATRANWAFCGFTALLPQSRKSRIGSLPLTGKAAIRQMFGPEFADALDGVMPGKWAGPVKSAFGLHIVFVSEHQPSRNPAFGEVRDAVAREWANEKRAAIDEARFSTLLRRYEVVIEDTSQLKANR